jgi:glycosyltransferase involved in cell wall biosynthesis
LITRRGTRTVSVVMGVYNSARWIRDALDSVLAQTYPASEIVVVDDGSTDDTPQIVRSYGGIVCYLREEHRGRPHRNRGILASRGDLVAFLDGDDYWDPHKLEEQMGLLDRRGLSWAYCEARWIEANTHRPVRVTTAPVQEGDILEPLLLNNFIVASTAVVARTVFGQVGCFDESPDVAAVEDWDLWLRIAARFPIGCVRQQLCTLRLHGDSFLAGLPTEERVQHLKNVVTGAVAREVPRLGSLKTEALANVSYAAGIQAFRRRNMQSARRYFLAALKALPSHLGAVGYIVLTLLGSSLATDIVKLKRRILGPLEEGSA